MMFLELDIEDWNGTVTSAHESLLRAHGEELVFLPFEMMTFVVVVIVII